jgi:RNA polymerase sigma factor (sigma-70 family)
VTTTESGACVSVLLESAAVGDEAAWRELVTRFHRLVWATARGCGVTEADAGDVAQTTWLRLAEQLGRITDPEALPGWLVTTTRREAVRVAKQSRRPLPTALLGSLDLDAEHDALERLITVERRQELRSAFRRLGERCRVLLAMLSADAPLTYEDISRSLSMPVGSIGPTRRRCLTKLAQLLERLDDAPATSERRSREPIG